MREQITITPNWESFDDKEETPETADGRLYATVVIGGTFHHLEAVPVSPTDEEMDAGANPTAESIIGGAHQAFGGDGPYETTEINGKLYAVFMTPFEG